jgi:hypothetical protein
MTSADDHNEASSEWILLPAFGVVSWGVKGSEEMGDTRGGGSIALKAALNKEATHGVCNKRLRASGGQMLLELPSLLLRPL